MIIIAVLESTILKRKNGRSYNVLSSHSDDRVFFAIHHTYKALRNPLL